MKTFIAAAGLAAAASAAVLPRQDQCCFSLTASGGQSGQIGQLSDGQNRLGGSYPAGQYCLNGGSITDSNDRGCILTPPTTQFQCDEGATPDSGFSVSGNGDLQHDGSSTFYACAADEGEYNIYTQTSDDQTQCVEITLSTDGECGGSGNGGASSAPAASQPTGSAAPSPSTYSVPASSPAGPESTAPATSEASVPHYSTPASSAPAESVPTPSAPSTPASAPSISTRIVTEYTTVCGCSESGPAPSAPASSAPASSAPAYSAPTSSVPAYSAPAPSAPAPSSYAVPSESKPAPVPSKSSPPGPESSAPAPPQSYPTSSVPAPSETAPVGESAATSTPGGFTTKPAASAATSSGSACQTSLVPGSYETPHLIVPVNSGSPDQSYGTTYNAYANGQNSTVFNFDIPSSYSDRTCTLVFLFPKKEDLETTDYTFNGQGSLDFAQLSGAVDQQTTYNSCPSKQQDLGSVTPQPGGSYVVQSGPCAAGTTETVQMSAGGGLELEFFEDWNPSPLGLFVTVC